MNGTDWILYGFSGGVLAVVLILNWYLKKSRSKQADRS